ncbi:MAG: NAD(+) diphosphatase [Burkholderiales bacterium]|nr:NAD(+) diphosphatase [Burkholderiales bacterium]
MPFATPIGYAAAVTPPASIAADTLWFVFRESRLLVAETAGAAPLPRTSDPRTLGLELAQQQYLGALGGVQVWCAEAGPGAVAPAGWAWRGLRTLYGVLDDGLFALAGRALQLVDWDRTHRHCGRCGTPTRPKLGERSRECPACGLVAYPRIAPAVMALVRRAPDEILLARSHHFPPGMYSALAGFAEPGETLEQCVLREVREEVDLRVSVARYFASQPWPFPHSLMIAFVCDWASGEVRADFLEIEAAAWFNIRSLPRLPNRISIARRLIDAVVAEMATAAR